MCYESYSHRSTYKSQIKLSKLNRISLTQEMMQMYLHHMNEEEMGPKRFWPKNKFWYNNTCGSFLWMVAARTTIGCSALIGCLWPSNTVKSPGFFEKGGEKKRKNPGINPGQPTGKGREKKKKKKPGINPGQPAGKGRGKKKTLVLTLGRSGAYTANPPEKGGKKKKKKKPGV